MMLSIWVTLELSLALAAPLQAWRMILEPLVERRFLPQPSAAARKMPWSSASCSPVEPFRTSGLEREKKE